MFKNPTAFKAEWDKFMESNPTYKLIADPALLDVLKKMWMRTGGTKLENKMAGSSQTQVDEARPMAAPRKTFKKAVTPSTEPAAPVAPDPAVAPAPVAPDPAVAPAPVAPAPVAPAPVAPASGNSIFADPKKLAASFEGFQEADGSLPPAFRGVLKDILLTALRTVESKQRKLYAIIKESKHLQTQVAALKKRKEI